VCFLAGYRHDPKQQLPLRVEQVSFGRTSQWAGECSQRRSREARQSHDE
jgi:hypothetical protein